LSFRKTVTKTSLTCAHLNLNYLVQKLIICSYHLNTEEWSETNKTEYCCRSKCINISSV